MPLVKKNRQFQNYSWQLLNREIGKNTYWPTLDDWQLLSAIPNLYLISTFGICMRLHLCCRCEKKQSIVCHNWWWPKRLQSLFIFLNFHPHLINDNISSYISINKRCCWNISILLCKMLRTLYAKTFYALPLGPGWNLQIWSCRTVSSQIQNNCWVHCTFFPNNVSKCKHNLKFSFSARQMNLERIAIKTQMF